jgi:YD repeat-containing protein
VSKTAAASRLVVLALLLLVAGAPPLCASIPNKYEWNALLNAGTGGGFTYTYNPVNGSTLGANQLASLQVSGSFANYTVAYQYDEWARSIGRTVDGSANSATWSFDSLGRVSAETNLLGSFTYAYAGATGRLQQITPSPANAPQIYFAYNDTATSGDRRLNQIRNLSGSTLVSQFDYSYSPRGQITRWQQQNSGFSQITALSLQYDPMGQLVGASNQDTASSAQLASNAFSYDPAGNRTSLQLDSQLSNETFNSLNQLVAQTGANGSLHFTGTVNKPSTVTVGGQIAQVDADGNFDALVPVIPGVNQVTVTATDVNHPAVNSAQTYQVTVSPVGAPLSGVSYDANGNLTADGTGQTYEYDSLDRVTAINESATLRSEFAYDGLGRRVQMIERSSGAISSEQSFVYDGWNLAEQRDTGNSVLRRYFAQGEQRLAHYR